MTSLGQIIRRARGAKGLTQKRVAIAIGKDQSYISDIERGHIKVPSQAILQDLARVLGRPLQELYDAVGWSASADAEGADDSAPATREDSDGYDAGRRWGLVWANKAGDFTDEEAAIVDAVIEQIRRNKRQQTP